MASSLYIYTDLSQYLKLYPVGQTILQETPIFDMYVKPPNKVWIVTQTNVAKEQPDLSRSQVHFRNGSANKWLEGNEILVHQDNVKYNLKTNKLEVKKIKIKVDRCIGGPLKHSSKLSNLINRRKKLNYQFRAYDMSRDRINLVLKDE